MKSRLLLLIAISLLVTGCGVPKGCREDRSSGISAADLPSPVYGAASISGVVRFEGEAPEMPVIEAAKHCGDIKEEWAVVGEGGELANVLVYLENAPPTSGREREAVLLDQVSCRFVPHVLGLQIGQPLVAKNSDLEFHNVHYAPVNSSATNFGLETYGKKRTTSFDEPEPQPVRVKCDVHPWMEAYIGVFAHPFYAVTDVSGRYTIDRVPAGEYKIKAWHERFGVREGQIAVADARPVTWDLLFARRGS